MKLNPNIKTVQIRTVGDLIDSLSRFPRETEVKLIASTGSYTDYETAFYGIDVVNMVDDLGVEIGSTENLES